MTFIPKYTITNKVLNNLTFISTARECIEQAYLVPQWEVKLRRQAIIHSSHSSTAIEGNKLKLKQVEELAQGKHIIATNKDKQEVLNYLEALEKIPSFGKKSKLTVNTLLNIHKTVSKDTLDKNTDCGVFRNRQVFVGRRIFDGTGFKTEVEYMPPETSLVPKLTEEFIDWLNLSETWEINPVLLAGIVHYEIARIHPFIDGNGRTARLFATLILFLTGFDHRRFFSLDDFYDRDRQSYYSALKTVHKETRDLTKWLEYFTDGVASSVNEVKEAIEKLGSKGKKGDKQQISLSPKQMQIVEYISKNVKATNRDFQSLFGVSAQAVHKELVKLVDLKIIKTQGRGRSVFYSLVDD